MESEKPEKKRGRGRPRKYETYDNAACVRNYRRHMNKETTRHDIYLGISASNKIKTLAEHWNYSVSQAIERLILESEFKYRDILNDPADFPEGLPDGVIESLVKEQLEEMELRAKPSKK
jgi:hypothetical protein